MPLISIIVTVYNLKEYIPRCLDGLLNQTFDDYEIVVVDNGSTDESPAICHEFALKYPEKVRFLSLGRPSVMHRAHQAGLDAARGTYCNIIDGDDFIRPDCLEPVAELIYDSDPDVVIGRFLCLASGEALPCTDVVFDPLRINGRPAKEVLAYLSELPTLHLAFWRYFFKKSMLDDTRLFESALPQNRECPLLDALVTLRILGRGQAFALLEEPFYMYNRRSGSLTSSDEKHRFWNIQSFTEFLFFANEGISEEARGFALIKLEQQLKLVLGKSDLLDESMWRDAEVLMKRSRDALFALDFSGAGDGLHNLYRQLRSDELENGFKKYFEAARIKAVDTLRSKKLQRLYLFPCGQFSRDVHRWITNAGLSSDGFLDNNPALNGRFIQGLACTTPEALTLLPAQQKEGATVVIATVYRQLSQTLREQCLSLGISEQNIMVF